MVKINKYMPTSIREYIILGDVALSIFHCFLLIIEARKRNGNINKEEVCTVDANKTSSKGTINLRLCINITANKQISIAKACLNPFI